MAPGRRKRAGGLLCLLMAAALIVGMSPTRAFAVDDFQSTEPSLSKASVERVVAEEASAEGADATESVVSADELWEFLDGLDIDDNEVVEVGFDPLFPERGCTVDVRSALGSELTGSGSRGDDSSASISVNAGTLEDTLLAGWDALSQMIDVSAFQYEIAEDNSFSSFFEDYVDVILAHPDRFNVRTSLAVSYNSSRTIVSVRPSYVASAAADYQPMKTAYEGAVGRALACVTDDMDDVSKTYALHDWLCDRATYHTAATEVTGQDPSDVYPKSFTSYGCMVEGLGVCQSYTLALADLLNRAGVDNAPLLVAAMNHAWNMVEVEGSWYNVDATWDDSKAEAANSGSSAYQPDYSYFLQSESKFADGQHHGWEAEGTYGFDAATMIDDDARYDNRDWKNYAPEGNEWCAARSSSRTEDLTLITKRSSNSMGADAPMRFYTQAWGGTGDYYYSFDSPQVFDRVDTYPTLVDPLNESFNREYGYARRGLFLFEFYASETYQLRTHVMDKRYNEPPYASASDTFNVALSDSKYPSVAERVNTVAKACVSAVGANASSYDKALWLHDYLIDNATYDLRYVKAEGVLARGRGNCESYHAAYTRLLKAVGVEAGRIESQADNHVWTAVKIEDQWCQVDVTWDDVDYKYTPFDLRHLYFGLTDELMGYAHKGHTAPVTGYESNSLDGNFLIRSGALSQRAEELAADVMGQLEKGNSDFTISERNASYPYWAQAYDGSSKTIYNNLLARELEKRQWEVDLNGNANKASLSVSYTNESNGESGFLYEGTFSVHADFTAIDGHKHKWGDFEIVEQPTCVNMGHQVKTCTECGAQVSESMPMVDHAWSSYVVTKKATCTVAGQSTSTCSTCGKKRTQMLQSTGHAWSAYTVTKRPTCTAEGVSASSCSKCGQVRSRTVNPTGHAWGEWVRVQDPTAAATGLDARTCANCGISQTREVAKLPAAGRWVKSGGKWWYENVGGGYPSNCWECIDGAWYHFDRSGWMQTGWLKVGGNWYYLSGSGAMKTGWLKLGRTWYYLADSGAMATGWYKVGGSWYWSNTSGAMGANRWVGNYYLKSSGAMATSQWIGRYHVNASGKWDKTR